MKREMDIAGLKFHPYRRHVLGMLLGAGSFAIGLKHPARAQETQFRVAIGQRGNWDSAMCELGQNAGIFKRHGFSLDITYTQGGGETIQAVLSRSVDVGLTAGTLGVLGAISKGAPLRIIGGEMTGVGEMYWYVPAKSPYKSIEDLRGKTVGFSTNGSSTHQAALNIQTQHNPEMKLVATGASPTTYTQVMSGQIDAGWSSAPFGLDALGREIREIFRGNLADTMRNQTVRSLSCHVESLEERRDEITRFLVAYKEAIDWMYDGDEPLAAYAQFAGVSVDAARRTRDEYIPKSALNPATFSGINQLMADAVKFKFLQAPLTEAQLSEAVQILLKAD